MPLLDAEFAILHTFATHPGILVRRARRLSDGAAVILKRPTEEAATDEEIARLSYEFGVLSHVHEKNPDPTVIKPLQVWGSLREATLVLEDIGGASLAELAHERAFSPEEVVALGQRIANALASVHAANVIHKDVNPRNIVYNRVTDALQLIDFGIAVRLDREVKAADGQQEVDGTLAYAPPEQVGRMARYADHRSDYYSLGATLYDLLCGRPPFVEESPNKLMHLILTAPPVAPSALNPRVPEPLSQVIMRLLDKAQERRYRSTRGIAYDLWQCGELLAGRLSHVNLGEQDRSEKFEIPEKIYGRHDELQALHRAFRSATERRTTLVFLGGPSGMGKSSLVAELQAELVGFDASFAAGKHDQLRRHMPFSALSQAVTAVVRGFLFESEVEVDYWRRSIQAAVGNIGQALVDVIPAIELLIGPQKPIAPLPTQETENRLHYLLQRLIITLATDRPLLLFLDDLQWADQGTIKLLHEVLYSNDNIAGLCIVAAYRDNEVSLDHPLVQLLRTLEEQSRPFTQIHLQPLDSDATFELLCEATGAPSQEVADLAPVVHAKTHGNPFFTRAYLQHLNRQGLLTFDTTRRHFRWDLATVKSTAVTDNVVALLTEKLRTLSEATQRILSAAACLGNEFHLFDLQHVTGSERSAVVQAAADALTDGLIVPLTANYRFAEFTQTDIIYKFAHDRIQQAIFELLLPADATRTHRTIGLYLLDRWRQQPSSVSIFDMLGHINAAASLVQDPTERIELAQLNLVGAQDAKRSGALAIALTYLQHAEQLAGEGAWERVPELKRSIELELADNEFLTGHIDAASTRLNEVVRRSPDPIARAEIQIRRVHALTAAGQLEAALQSGVEGLRGLGLNLPDKPTRAHQVLALVRLLVVMAPHKLVDLPNLPAAQDKRVQTIIALMSSFKMAAFYASPMMFALLALVAPTVTIRYGTSRASSSSFGLFALVLVQMNMYRSARRLVTVAREGLKVWADSLDKGAVEFSGCAFVEFIDMTPDAFVAQMRRAYTIGLEEGDPLFGGWAGLCGPLALMWVSFGRCERELHVYEGYLQQRNEPHQMLTMRMTNGMMALFTAKIDVTAFNDPTLRVEAEKIRGTGSAHWVCIQTAAMWLFGDLQRAWQAVQDGRAWRSHEAMGEFMMPFYALYGALTYCDRRAQGLAVSVGETAYFWQLRLKLRAMARAGRVNYGGMDTLVAAVYAGPHSSRAARLFDQAIGELAGSDFVVARATAMECAGRYFVRRGMTIAARGYLEGAMEMYLSLGAEVKSVQLMREFASINALRARRDATSTRPSSLSRTVTTAPSTRRITASRAGGDSLAVSSEAFARQLCQAALRETSRDELAAIALEGLMDLSMATRTVVSLGQVGGSDWVLFDTAPAGTPLPDHVLAYAWRAREAVFVNEVKEADSVQAAYLAAQHPCCYGAIPALSRGKTMGVVYLENNVSPDLFTPARSSSLVLAVDLIAVAFELQRYRTQLAEIAASQASALRTVADRVVQQERESTELQLAGGFAHEMRNALSAAAYPLAILASHDKESTEALEDLSVGRTYDALLASLTDAGVEGTLLERLREANQVLQDVAVEIGRGVSRALVLTRDILDYAQASHIIPGSNKVRLLEVCETILWEQRSSFEKEGIAVEITVPDDLHVYIAEPHAYAIARNIISNARDAVCMRDAANGRRIVIGAQQGGDTVLFSVQDNGVGIDEKQRGRVFQPFYTTKGTRGTGLGLGFTRKVVMAYGGKVDFVSQPGVGTTFEVELPVAQATASSH